MSGHLAEIEEDATRAYPTEYLKAEYNAPSRSPPYGPAWPGGFRVGAGALLFFFGAFLGFMALALLAGPLGLVAAAGLMTLALVGLSMLIWSGLRR